MGRAAAAAPAAGSVLLGALSFSARAADSNCFDDRTLTLVGTVRSRIVEPPVPVLHIGALLGRLNVVEGYDRVPGTSGFPLTAPHLVSKTCQRFTYESADGTTGASGSPAIGTLSLRTSSGLQLVPPMSRAVVTTGIPERYSVSLQRSFGPLASERNDGGIR